MNSKEPNKYFTLSITVLLIAICFYQIFNFIEDLNDPFLKTNKFNYRYILGFILIVPLLTTIKLFIFGNTFSKNRWYISLSLAMVGSVILLFQFIAGQ